LKYAENPLLLFMQEWLSGAEAYKALIFKNCSRKLFKED
jgi:hypothetical protein